VDRYVPKRLYEHYPELAHRKFYVSLVGHGEELLFIRDSALDFFIANHVIEHCQDPIGTLRHFARCLKSGGVVFLAVPEMRKTFDIHRTETTIEHLLRDHGEGSISSREAHYHEWAELVEERTGADASRRARELMAADYSIHFHCWTRDGFRDFINGIESDTGLLIADVMSWRNENVFILKSR
jgi:predicted SAM-dependent methyltransferase